MNGDTWVLVTDSSNARIFATHKAKLFKPEASEKDLILVNQFNHPESRKRDIELVSDNSGRYSSAEYGADTYEPPTDPKRYEEDRFATMLCQELHQGYNQKQFKKLIIIAPPVFIGMLNKHISRQNGLHKSVDTTIEKDYTQLNERELVKQLNTLL